MATTEYPKIIINETDQAAIPGMKFNLTVEQYYDLLHHTHNMLDLVSKNESSENTEINESMSVDEKIEVLSSMISDINTTITEMQQNILALQYTLEEVGS